MHRDGELSLGYGHRNHAVASAECEADRLPDVSRWVEISATESQAELSCKRPGNLLLGYDAQPDERLSQALTRTSMVRECVGEHVWIEPAIGDQEGTQESRSVGHAK